MDVAHRAGDLSLRNVQDPRPQRGVEIPVRADLNLRIPALLNERGQPAHLEISTNDDEQVGPLEPEDETRLRLDEVRILVTTRDCLHLDAIAAHLSRDRCEVLSRRDDVQPALRQRRRRGQQQDDRDGRATKSHEVHTLSSVVKTDARRERLSKT